MRKDSEIIKEFKGLFLIAQNFPSKELEEHLHDRVEIIIPLSGEIKFNFDNFQETIGPGRLIVIPANTSHRFESSDRNGYRLVVLVDGALLDKERLVKFKEPKVVVTNQLYVEIIFNLILNEGTGYVEDAKLLLMKITEDLIGKEDQVFINVDKLYGLAKDERLKKSLNYMFDNFRNEELSLEEIAKVSGYSQRSMRRLFLDELKQSPKQALSNIRIQEAKKLLLDNNLSITDVCFDSGFSSMSTFTQNFKKSTGIVPTEYRFRETRS